MSWLRNPQSILIAIGLVGLMVLLTLGSYRFALISPGSNDFMAHYSVWRAFFERGLNPYSDKAGLDTQQRIYGRPANSTEDQNRLTYPFYSIVLNGPFSLIADYPLARAIYMAFLEAALILGLWLTMRVVAWRPPFWLLAVMLLWVLLDYPQARGIILGQFAIFGFLSLVMTMYLLQRGHDGWAGAVLVLSTMKPTLVFLVVPFLLLWTLLRRRWRFALGFVMTLAGSMLLSWLLLPTWLTDWLYRVSRYSEYTVGQSPVWLFTHLGWPAVGQTGEVVLTILLLGLMLLAWWQSFKTMAENCLLWTLGATLVVSDLIISRSATTNYVLLLLPMLWLFCSGDAVALGTCRHRRPYAVHARRRMVFACDYGGRQPGAAHHVLAPPACVGMCSADGTTLARFTSLFVLGGWPVQWLKQLGPYLGAIPVLGLRRKSIVCARP